MRILLTNDDGIDALGLHVLAAAMRALGDVTVAAPATNQTGVSRAITLAPTIAVDEVDLPDGTRGFAVAGTPSDCVRFAVLGLPERPDLVVSGSNRGVNLGDDVSYSGTVAAALEGVFLGLPAIAVSQQARGRHRGLVRRRALRLRPDLRGRRTPRRARPRATGCPDGTMLNVNGPGRDGGPLGVRLTRLGRRIYGTPRRTPHGRGGSSSLPPVRPRASGASRRGRHRSRRDRRRLRVGEPAAPATRRRLGLRAARELEDRGALVSPGAGLPHASCSTWTGR